MNKGVVISLVDARKQLNKQKAIFVITKEDDMANKEGYLAFVSDDEKTYDEMMMEFDKLKRENQRVTIIGSYENGGAVGVQYSVQ